MKKFLTLVALLTVVAWFAGCSGEEVKPVMKPVPPNNTAVPGSPAGGTDTADEEDADKADKPDADEAAADEGAETDPPSE